MSEFESSLLHHVLQSMADRAAAEGPSGAAADAAKAIVDAADGTGLSLADLAATAANVAREWRRGGVRHGDTVTLFLPNMAEFYVPVLAAWLCGAAVSCTDPDVRALTLARQVKLTGQSSSPSHFRCSNFWG
jgi:acyl-coenzyme A synthetase/AMP-(fatty) acid ligase